MKVLKVIALIALLTLNVGAFGALYVEGKMVYEILNAHTH